MSASRHRCLVAVQPRLFGDALARLLPRDRLDVVIADDEMPSSSAHGPFDIVITGDSIDGEKAPLGVVRVTLAGEGAAITGITVSGPGRRTRRFPDVTELVPFLVTICDELAAVGPTR